MFGKERGYLEFLKKELDKADEAVKNLPELSYDTTSEDIEYARLTRAKYEEAEKEYKEAYNAFSSQLFEFVMQDDDFVDPEPQGDYHSKGFKLAVADHSDVVAKKYPELAELLVELSVDWRNW